MKVTQPPGTDHVGPEANPDGVVRVLLCDDEEDSYCITRTLLARVDPDGYEVTWISEAAEALPLLATRSHDICLLDLHLGRHNGLAVLAESRRAAWPTPILLLTSERARDRDIEAMRLGAAGYLEKGDLEPRALDRAIRYALRRREDLDAVKEEADRYASALCGWGEGVWIWDATNDTYTFSPGLADWLQHGPSERPGLEEWVDHILPEDRDGFRKAMLDLQAGRAGRVRHEYRIRSTDGSVRWMLARGEPARTAAADLRRVTGSVGDITELKDTEFRLRREALFDPLTGLANRNLLLERLSSALARRQRHSDFRFALLFLDLDHFKAINDTQGHLAGDKLLHAVAKRLGRCLRANDTAGRLGGDEFAVLLDDIANEYDAVRVAHRIQRDLARPFELDGQRATVSVSIGIAHARTEHVAPEELLRDADVALYRAKKNGRARCEIFDVALHAAAMESLQLESELHRAIQDRSFRLVYEPVFELRTGRPVALEGSVRWSGATRDVTCLRIIEESGHSIPLARGTLELACSHLAGWRDRERNAPRLPIYLNLTHRQLQDPRAAETAERALAEYGLEPKDLGIKVQERVFSEVGSCHALADLRRLGVRIVIDDYGRGSTSLAALPRLPVDGLKIDPALTDPASTDSDWSIAGVIVSLAEQLDLVAIAEGVATEEQRARLIALGCHWGQGSVLGGHLDPERIPDWLRKHPSE